MSVFQQQQNVVCHVKYVKNTLEYRSNYEKKIKQQPRAMLATTHADDRAPTEHHRASLASERRAREQTEHWYNHKSQLTTISYIIHGTHTCRIVIE